MEWGGTGRVRNSDRELIINNSVEVFEDEVLDDKLLDNVTPQISILDAEDIGGNGAFCSRCRTISSTFLSPPHYETDCNGFPSQSCRYDQSVQQFYSVPNPDDDVPLLEVSYSD